MNTDTSRLHRRSIRLMDFDYTRPGAYFVTMVTQDRLCLFGEDVGGEMRLSPMGNIACQQWQRLPSRFPHLELAEFVVMPNHVHGIIIIYDDDHQNALDTHTRRGTAGGLTPPVVQTNRRAPTDSPTLLSHATDSPDARTGTAGGLTPPVVQTNRRAPTDSPTLLAPTTDSPTLEQFGQPVPGSIPTIIRSYKSAVAYRLNLIRRTPAAAIWQRNYYEHIIRNEADYHRIVRYILENPAQWEKDDENRQ